MAAGEVAAAPGSGAPAEEGAGAYVFEADALFEHPADGGLGQVETVAGEHDAQPGLAHEGECSALSPHRPLPGARPVGRAHRARGAAPRGESAHAGFAVAPPPAEQGGPGPADGSEGGGLGAALGAEGFEQLDSPQPVEGVWRGRFVDLDGAVGDVSLGVELHGSASLMLMNKTKGIRTVAGASPAAPPHLGARGEPSTLRSLRSLRVDGSPRHPHLNDQVILAGAPVSLVSERGH